MNEYDKKTIMEQSKHLFVYANNTEERTNYIEEMIKEYPIKINNITPMAIYLKEYGLPHVVIQNKSCKQEIILILAREYFELTLLYSIFQTIKENINIENINIEKIIKLFNTLYNNKDELTSLDEIIKALNNSRNAYYDTYIDYMESGVLSFDPVYLQVPWVCEIEMFSEYIKRILNNDSYFAIVINHTRPLNTISYQVINSYVGSRINQNISMKIITTIDGWNNYYDLNGNFVENIHDYGTIDLDGKQKECMQRLKIN